MALQAIAFLVEFDRLVERRLAALEQPDDLLEPRQRRLEAQLAGRLTLGSGSAASITAASDPLDRLNQA